MAQTISWAILKLRLQKMPQHKIGLSWWNGFLRIGLYRCIDSIWASPLFKRGRGPSFEKLEFPWLVDDLLDEWKTDQNKKYIVRYIKFNY